MITPKKTFNGRFGLILLLVISVLGVGTHLVHAFQVRRNASILLHQGDKAAQEKNLKKAGDYYKRYLTLAPGDNEARAKYALLLASDATNARKRTLVQVYLMMEQVLRRQPDRADVRRKAIELAMHWRLARYSDALAHLQQLMDTEGKSAEILSLQARCKVAMRPPQYKEARLLWEEALTLSADWEDYLRLANLLLEQTADVKLPKKTAQHSKGKPVIVTESLEEVRDKADATIALMLKTHPKDYQAHLAAARYVVRRWPNNTDKGRLQAAKHIEAARRLAPDEAEVILAFATVEQERNNAEGARAELQRGIKLHAQSFVMYQALAQLEIAEKRPEAALTVLRRGLAKLPGHLDLKWNLAHLLIHEGHVAEAEQEIKALAKKDFPEAELDYLWARFHFKKERWRKATELVEKALPGLLARADHERDWLAINLVVECYLLMGRCYEQMGDPDAAASAYHRGVVRNPASLDARFGLARMEWESGRFEMAQREYRSLMQLPRRPAQAWIEYGQLLIVQNLRSKRPDWSEFDRILREAEGMRPVPVEVSLLRAEKLAAEKQFARASDFLEQAHENKQTRPLEVWIGLADLAQSNGKWEAALALLDDAEKRVGDRLELRLARCRFWMRRGGTGASAALDQLGRSLDNYRSEDQRRLLRSLAEAYWKLDKLEQAKATWRRIMHNHKTDLGSRIAMFDLALHRDDQQKNDQQTMTDMVEAIREIEGDRGAIWRFCKATQLIDQSVKDKDSDRLEQANELLTAIAKKRLSWGRVWLALGQIKDLRGQAYLEKLSAEGKPDDGAGERWFRAAIEDYRKAVRLGERNPVGIRRAVGLLTERARYIDAKELLDELRGNDGVVAGLERLQAEIAMRTHKPELALDLAKRAVPPDSEKYDDHIWLGHLHWAAAQEAEAEAEYRKAIKLAPDVPEPLVALVHHLSRTKRQKEAEQILQQAEKKLPKDRSLLAMAQCHEIIGNLDRAKVLLETALAAKPNDPATLKHLALVHLNLGEKADVDKAKEYLNAIIKLKDLSPAQVRDAERALASLFVLSRDYQDRKKALEKLGYFDDAPAKLPTENMGGLATQRAKILLLATATNPRQRRQAAILLEDLLNRKMITPDERFLLAQVYESIGEWPKAKVQMLFLLSGQDPKTRDKDARNRYLGQLDYFCAGLLQHDFSAQAAPWIAKLELLEPESFRTVAFRAKLQYKKGQGAQAAADLRALAKTQEPWLGPIALLLEQIDQPNAAEEVLRKFVAQSKRPEAQLVLAEFLSKQNRIEEALALCEGALKTCSADVVAAAAVAVLYNAKEVQDSQCQRVAGWISQGIQQSAKPAALRFHLAATRRLQKDYSETIALYRYILKESENDSLVLNNLAWLVALHEGNAAEALKVISRAIALEGPLAEFLDTRAVIYITMGDAVKALADLEEAIAERPTPERYFHQVQAHLLAKNHRAALDAFQNAKRLNLNETTVDPLERASYQRLRDELEITPR